MMFFKSKVFWICAALTVCAVIFFGVMVHRANQPQEVIKVYKTVEFTPRKTPQPPADNAISGQILHNTATEGDTTDTTIANFIDDETPTTDTFTHTADDFWVDESTVVDTVDALETAELNAAAQAEAEYISQQLAELYIKIPQSLQYRLDLWDHIEELAESYVPDGGPSPVIEQLLEEYRELTRDIFAMSNRYIVYAKDNSLFEPSGEFYDLLKQNGMRVELNLPPEF